MNLLNHKFEFGGVHIDRNVGLAVSKYFLIYKAYTVNSKELEQRFLGRMVADFGVPIKKEKMFPISLSVVNSSIIVVTIIIEIIIIVM